MKLSKLFSGSPGAHEVRLELARTYAELGSAELARQLLAEVREDGNRQQRALAEDLLAELA